jgi:hypothetical protein
MVGERAFTTLALLNDDFGPGGATAFPKLGLSVKVKAGDLIVWQNLERHWDKEEPKPTAEATEKAAAAGSGQRKKAMCVALLPPKLPILAFTALMCRLACVRALAACPTPVRIGEFGTTLV